MYSLGGCLLIQLLSETKYLDKRPVKSRYTFYDYLWCNEPLHGGFDDAKVRVRFIVSNFFVLFPSSLLRQMLKIATNRGHALQICRIPHPE